MSPLAIELYDNLINYGIATEDEIGIAFHFSGTSLNTLEEVLFYKTGYRNWEDYVEDYL